MPSKSPSRIRREVLIDKVLAPTAEQQKANDIAFRSGLTPEQLASAIAAFKGNAPESLDTAEELANAVLKRLRFDVSQELTAEEKARVLASLGISNTVQFQIDQLTAEAQLIAGSVVMNVGGYQYQIQIACPANATTTVNGENSGIDDVIGKLDIVISAPGSTSTLMVQDGTTGTTYPISPVGGYQSAGNIEVKLGWVSTTGAWRVICGAGLSAVASMS